MKNFLILIILFSILLAQSGAFAYSPNADVLFKNVNNPLYSGETTSALFKIKNLGKNSDDSSANITNAVISEKWAQLTMSRLEKKTFFTQAIFVGNPIGNGQNGQLAHFIKTTDLINKIQNNDKQTYAMKLFYGVCEYILANNNVILLEVFDQLGINLKRSSQTINRDQSHLLDQYLRFAKRRKKNPKLTEKDSPLYSSEYSQQVIINKTLKESFYTNDERATLDRWNGKFVWKVEKAGLKAYFDQISRRIYYLEIKNPKINISYEFSGITIFNGLYNMPQKMAIKLDDQPVEEIEISSPENYRENSNQWYTRTSNLAQRVKKGESLDLPFLLLK